MEAHVAVAAGAAVCAGGAGPSTVVSLTQIQLHLAQIGANDEEWERRLAAALNAGEAATTLTESARKDLEAVQTQLKNKNAELETLQVVAQVPAQKLLDLEARNEKLDAKLKAQAEEHAQALEQARNEKLDAKLKAQADEHAQALKQVDGARIAAETSAAESKAALARKIDDLEARAMGLHRFQTALATCTANGDDQAARDEVMAKPADDDGPSPYHYYHRGASSWTWKWNSSVGSRGKLPFQGVLQDPALRPDLQGKDLGKIWRGFCQRAERNDRKTDDSPMLVFARQVKALSLS